MSKTSPDGSASLGTRVREAVSEALTYWEPRRIVYNAVLGFIVLAYFAINWPYSRTVVSFNGVSVVFVLAVLANVCYCTAYLGGVSRPGVRVPCVMAEVAMGPLRDRHGSRGSYHAMVRHRLLHASRRIE